MSADQVRAELDRVNGRLLSIKRAATSQLDAGDELRVAFLELWGSWRTFYESARDDVLAWGSNVAQSDAYDREADDYRAALAARGIDVANPTRPAERESWIPEFGGGVGTGLALAGLAAVAIWAATR